MRAGRRYHVRPRRRAFTLLELVVAMGIIAILVSILLPAMQACRRSSRNLKCLSQLRRATYEFRLFADDFAYTSRGDSDAFGPQRFEIEDFQESLYRIAEYWDLPRRDPATYEASNEVMMCPEGPSFLQRLGVAGSCSQGLVVPKANVSLALNMRLFRRVEFIEGGVYLVPTTVTSQILDHPNVPLLVDVDGEEAFARGQLPYYTAPPVRPDDPYGASTYWYPSYRHQGCLNVGFVGGHVLSSRRPLDEPGWDWAYQPSN